MTTLENATEYVKQLATAVGSEEAKIYNANTKSWWFTRGSASIEVFFTTYEASAGVFRTFLRVFSPILEFAKGATNMTELYIGALEANVNYMGVKIGMSVERGVVYAIAGRDIDGMDYNEFVKTVNDLGYWADQLDDFLKERFPAVATPAVA